MSGYTGICLLLICLSVGNVCTEQGYNRVVITEILADPIPAIGLPEVEYIELFNPSAQPLSLKNWKLTIGGRSWVFPDAVLGAHDYVILCSAAQADQMRNYGNVIPLGPFSLANDGATLSLYSPTNQLVFSVSYSLNLWPTDKRDGGYSLEMLDSGNPCGQRTNWAVSADPKGGTPGKVNSISASNPDLIPPEIQYLDIISANELRITADEKLDSLNAVAGALITVSGRKILKKKLESPGFRNVILTVNSPFLENVKYTVSVKNLSDCAGNLLREAEMLIGLPSKADSGDVVLNEILFNPPDNGVDFVEIYNNTAKFISLKNWSLGNIKNGEPDVFKTITDDTFILLPFSCLALTTDQVLVKQLYPTDKTRHFLEVSALPAFSNTAGGVVLKDADGRIFDRFDYTEKMHDPLIHAAKGISLEKKDVFTPSQHQENWHSAAYNVGNATPGYTNSQMKSEVDEDIFEIEPDAFTPDYGGTGHFAVLKYKLTSSGQIATVRIYDITGRFVRNLVRNQMIGATGEMRWDGRDESGEVVRTGYYLLLTDLFDANGNKRQFKNKVVVVKK
ncbi:lamin tail domain-containing protein [Dyadobacter sp. LHD-138]|uniref:lamin tail domain-containing protein n=1 Tax=Dyadobacter sp. LHD-138 TaxID=3071413 RepID=UPI0027E1306B|nr:lamin tail domain-containing protein [Dyadobacter sp. LHD-138]MDQ6478354.1 lamin tail domain-containing protein [Dyadobacter sp. LHD-138]